MLNSVLQQSNRTRQFSRLDLPVTIVAQGYEIAQVIGLFIIVVIQAIRSYVMNRYNILLFWFANLSAYLAFVTVSLERFVALSLPVFTSVLNSTRNTAVIGFASLRTIFIGSIRPAFKCFSAMLAYTFGFLCRIAWVCCMVVSATLRTVLASVSEFFKRCCEFFTAPDTALCFSMCLNIALIRAIFSPRMLSVHKGFAAIKANHFNVINVRTAIVRTVNSVGVFRVFVFLAACWASLDEGFHSVSLSLYHMLVWADGVNCRRSGISLAHLNILPQING